MSEEEEKPAEETTPAPAGDNKRVLVIDDDPTTLELIRSILFKAGLEVFTAKDGQEGMKIVADQSPALVVIDVLMPNMDGFTFFKELKKDEKTEKISVLVLTSREKMKDTFEVMGADDFLTKPLNVEKFLNKINERLGNVSIKQEVIDSAVEEAKTEEDVEEKKAEEPAAKSVKNEQVKVFITGKSDSAIQKMTSLLEKEMCAVQSSTNGREAVKAIREFAPDCFILDVLINGMEVKDLIGKIRKIKDFKETPIVTYEFVDKEELDTSQANKRKIEIEKAKSGCLGAGSTEYIGSFDESKFIEQVEQYLKRLSSA